MPMNLVQNADGSFALRNELTGRDALTVKANERYAWAGVPEPRFFDDFLGDVIADQWAVAKGSDGSAADFAASAATEGIVVGSTGADADGTLAKNGAQLHSFLNWKANQGGLIFEARVKISAITNVGIFVGLTDQIAALEMPIKSAASANTITTDATDAVGFFFDTAMTTDNIWLAGVKNNTDATHQNSALAFVADTYRTLRIELTATGEADFFIDGTKVGTRMAAALTATVALTPVVCANALAAAAVTVTVDYILVQANRS